MTLIVSPVNRTMQSLLNALLDCDGVCDEPCVNFNGMFGIPDMTLMMFAMKHVDVFALHVVS